MSDIDTDYTDSPVCPACGHVHEDWQCAGDGDEDDCECEECGESMDVSTHMSISYSTSVSPPRCKQCKGTVDRPGYGFYGPDQSVGTCVDAFHATVGDVL